MFGGSTSLVQILCACFGIALLRGFGHLVSLAILGISEDNNKPVIDLERRCVVSLMPKYCSCLDGSNQKAAAGHDFDFRQIFSRRIEGCCRRPPSDDAQEKHMVSALWQ